MLLMLAPIQGPPDRHCPTIAAAEFFFLSRSRFPPATPAGDGGRRVLYKPVSCVYSIQSSANVPLVLCSGDTSLVTSLNPVERPLALGDQVYRTLRAHLRNGKILPGYPLQEVQLADRLGVSRTPVREALTRLASEGLVSSDGRSFSVPALTLQIVDDIYEVRFLVEPEALRHVAEQSNDPAALSPIMQALEASVAAHKAGNNEAFIDANALFRSAWLALVPNRRLVHAVELYADHVQHLRALTLGNAKVRTVVLRGLKRIAAALAAGDGDAAALAMREHLTEAKRAFIAAVGLGRGKPSDSR